MGYDLKIMNEDGYVNTDALLADISAISDTLSGNVSVLQNILHALGSDVPPPIKKTEHDTGAIISVQDVINACSVERNKVRLPQIPLNKSVYAGVKKHLINGGGSWVGGKTQAFVFPFNPERVMSELKTGHYVNLQQDYQFFETPDDLADRIVALSSVKESDNILEPSAGRGAIIRAIHRVCPTLFVECFELMPENREILLKLTGVDLIGFDFIKEHKVKKYDKIIANPPFSNNQDMDHVRLMYDCLAEGGRLVSITGLSHAFREDRKAAAFREWLTLVKAKEFPIEKGAFKDNGTAIVSNILVIDKP